MGGQFKLVLGGQFECFFHNTSNSSIPNNNVGKIAFDSSNNIWFISNGLTKFDGTNWTSYNYTNSQIPQSITGYAIFIDNLNNIWVTYDQGISKFDGINCTNYNSNIYNLPNYTIYSITQDNSDNMLFGTFDGRIIIFDGNNWQNLSASNYPFIGREIIDIEEDSHGNIWFTSSSWDTIQSGGVYKYNDTTFSYYNVNNSGLPSNRVFAVEEDLSGFLWFCTDKGVCRFDGNSWTTFDTSNSDLASNYVTCMAVDSSNKKWFGSLHTASSVYNDTNWVIHYNSGINSIAVDFNNNVWIGGTALQKFNGSWSYYNENNSGLLSDQVGKLYIDKTGNLLITYLGALASKFDGTNWTTWDHNNSNLPYSHISSIDMDILGNLWFLSSYELTKFDGINWYSYPPSNCPIGFDYDGAILIDSKGRKWFGGDGIDLFTESNLLYNKHKISGKIYFDENGNGIKELAEFYLESQKMRNIPDTTFALTNYTKNYTFYSDSGNYTVQYIPQNPWHLSACQGTFNVSVSNNDITIPDIGVVAPDTTLFNIDITLIGATCNSTEPLKISFINNGNTLNGVIGFIPDTSVQIMQSTPAVDSVSINGTYWYHFSNLLPGNESQIWVELMMPDFTAMGDTMAFSAFIQSNGYTFTDTTYEINTCSFDPNEKSVCPKGILLEHYTLKTDRLEYTIRFQNTGSDVATNIIITDTLSSWLDINSFEFISSSHTNNVNLSSDGKLIFYFTNINLPDSCHNEQSSHGFVKFRIRPKANIPENTVINNKANIFFDYNPPIITDNVYNTMVSFLPTDINSENNLSVNDIIIYPNPAHSTISLKNIKSPYEIEIFNYLGEKVFQENCTNQTNTFNINNLKRGIYLVKINNGKQSVSKLIIE